MRLGELCGRHSQLVGGQVRIVQGSGVTQNGVGARCADVFADLIDDLNRRQRLAEHLQGQFAAAWRHDVPPRAQLFSQLPQHVSRTAAWGDSRVDTSD